MGVVGGVVGGCVVAVVGCVGGREEGDTGPGGWEH